MSDSEYYANKRSTKGAKKQVIEEFLDSDEEARTSSGLKSFSDRCVRKQRIKKTGKNHPEDNIGTDEEATSKKSKQVSKPPLKRKASNKKTQTGWLESEDEDEAIFRQKSKKQPLQSVLSRRVADGVLRRTAVFAGDVFVDLKIYNVADVLDVNPKDRWEHAVLSVKYQAFSDDDTLLPLKEFVNEIKPTFKEEGKFFSTKKK